MKDQSNDIYSSLKRARMSLQKANNICCYNLITGVTEDDKRKILELITKTEDELINTIDIIRREYEEDNYRSRRG